MYWTTAVVICRAGRRRSVRSIGADLWSGRSGYCRKGDRRRIGRQRSSDKYTLPWGRQLKYFQKRWTSLKIHRGSHSKAEGLQMVLLFRRKMFIPVSFDSHTTLVVIIIAGWESFHIWTVAANIFRDTSIHKPVVLDTVSVACLGFCFRNYL